MNLGENIYRYRTQKKLSQGDLANALEVSRQSVSKWENNSAVPELDKLRKMAAIFEVTLDELVSGEETEQAKPQPVQPPSSPPAQERLPARKFIGIIFLCIGLVCSITCIILAIVLDQRYEEDLMAAALILGVPITALGICCLLVRKHTLLACGWVLYIPLWFTACIVDYTAPIAGFTAADIFRFLVLGFGAVMTVSTLVLLWKRKAVDSLPIRILLTVLVLSMLLMTACGLLPPSQLEAIEPQLPAKIT